VQPENLYAGKLNSLHNLIGNQDAILVADPQGKVIFSKNAGMQLIPASTLKILTALVALHYMGPDFRFATEFYLDKSSNLKVKGFGDPLLITETLAEIARDLAARFGTEHSNINNLVLDDSYFNEAIEIPGVTSSYEPYDAPNGALCVNFNTVHFMRNQNGAYVSAEPQTPLLPFVFSRINASNLDHGRIILSRNNNEITLYAGHLILYFLNKEGIKSNGRVRMGIIRKEVDKLFFRYVSRFSLAQVISRLFEYSNNFVANQLLITAGANAYGSPGTLDKGVRAAITYSRDILKIDNISIVEGSGISRKNRIAAEDLYKVLKAFSPYYFLLHQTGKAFYKTGTLHGINTRAGYIKNAKGELHCFVVLINTPGKTPNHIMDILQHDLD
jgi:D-alanyl-D-alanine carboxypeptidase/D-alanyl-D-alanine-endopeptidase (penicillin-binding protein 4)